MGEARLEGTFSGNNAFFTITPKCANGPCGGKINVPAQGEQKLQQKGSRYIVSLTEKEKTPGPIPYSTITTTYEIAPAIGAWIDGEWRADVITVRLEIEVATPAIKVRGVRLDPIKQSEVQNSRAFLQP